MPIDLASENPIPLKIAARHRLFRAKAKGGRAVNFSTVWRWALHGLRGQRLETVRIGATLCTTERAIIRFIERSSEPDRPHDAPTPSEIQRAHDAAEKRLAAAGA
jgi:uncharacterized protein DUF1580